MLQAEGADWAKPPKQKSLAYLRDWKNILNNCTRGQMVENEAGEIGRGEIIKSLCLFVHSTDIY